MILSDFIPTTPKTFKSIIIFLFLLSTYAATAQSQTRTLKKDSLLLDIEYLEGILTEAHPGLYRYNSKEDIVLLFKNLRNQVKDNIEEKEWMILLSQTINDIKCGHTYLNPWNMKKSIRNRLFGGNIYLPLGFKVLENEMIVTHNLTDFDIRKGDQIISIDGHFTKQILDSLRTIVSTDGNNKNALGHHLSLDEFDVSHWELFDLNYHLFFSVNRNFMLEIKSYKEDSIKKYVIPALSKQERMDRYKGLSVDRWDFEIREDKAIMKLGDFAIWNWKDFDYKIWFQDAFQKLGAAQINNLIIDIRGNTGGLGEVRDELLSYLITAPVEAHQQKILVRTTKVDEKYKPYSDTWVKWIFEGLSTLEYRRFNEEFYELSESFDSEIIHPKKTAFKGNVYMLGDASNVSATFTLLENTKQLETVYFVGNETGGNKQGINGGEYIFFYLPYSGMEVDVPLKFFYGGANRKDEGVQPDYEVSYNKEDIATNFDPYLSLVEKLIKEKK
ncbi:MAG: S41 family peptidase [Bacteroidota bacterium]